MAKTVQAPHEFFPTCRVFRVAAVTNVPPVYVDDIPIGELPRAYEWVAEHLGPGDFDVCPLEPSGARYLPGRVTLHVGIDRRPRQTQLAPAGPTMPVAAAAPATSVDPFAGALSLVRAVVDITKGLTPTAAAPAPVAPAFDPVKILTAGLELGQAAAKGGGKKKKGVAYVVDAVKENADTLLPLASGALDLGKGLLDWLKDVTEEAKKDKARAAAAAPTEAQAEQSSSSPAPAAASPPTEDAPSSGGSGDAPPAAESSTTEQPAPPSTEPAA